MTQNQADFMERCTEASKDLNQGWIWCTVQMLGRNSSNRRGQNKTDTGVIWCVCWYNEILVHENTISVENILIVPIAESEWI